ncbi:MAG TPA: hypothetical protein VGE12_12840 [Noviherbaspirillum sp.]
MAHLIERFHGRIEGNSKQPVLAAVVFPNGIDRYCVIVWPVTSIEFQYARNGLSGNKNFPLQAHYFYGIGTGQFVVAPADDLRGIKVGMRVHDPDIPQMAVNFRNYRTKATKRFAQAVNFRPGYVIHRVTERNGESGIGEREMERYRAAWLPPFKSTIATVGF